MIIYSPLIEEIIPAFTKTGVIKIPFEHNPAVSEYQGMSLRISDFANNTIITTLSINSSEIISPAEFTLTNTDLLKEHTYYKFQLAYQDNSNDTLYYSAVGIGKCVTAPANIYIEGFTTESAINYNPTIYKGVYEAGESEPAYWYRFQFYKEDTTLIQDTGLLLVTDANNMICELKDSLEYGIKYTVVFSVITVNGLESSVKYGIVKAGSLPNLFEGNLIATPYDEEGYIEISLTGQAITGNFRLYRSSDGKVWDIIKENIVMNSYDDLNTDRFKWRDYAAIQGENYYYGLAQTANNIISLKKISSAVSINYEDMFLSDGEKQLKIRLNPKVASFKETLSEAKTDTIGSKYPFFARNAAIRYKEFSISGLISYQMDNNQTFMRDVELGLSSFSQSRDGATATDNDYVRTTDLLGYNYAAERIFKLAVLEWLNNGKPKFFRSPAEGNYVVRLMNVSLTPNETLGRLIHTFNCTAYECDDASYATLHSKNLLPEAQVDTSIPTEVAYNTYIMASNPGFGFTLAGPADNIIFETLYPSLDTKFYLDDEEYIVYGTRYSIGSITNDQILNIPWNNSNAYATITYKYTSEPQTPDPDQFVENVNNTEDYYGAVNSNELNNYYYIYTLIITAETDCEVRIGDNPSIICRAGETRTYADINSNIQININGDATIIVHGRKWK